MKAIVRIVNLEEEVKQLRDDVRTLKRQMEALADYTNAPLY